MQGLFISYLRNSFSLSVIALLIMAFSPLLSRRYTAKCRYYLWAVVFVALLLPIRPQISVVLPEALRSTLPSNITDGGATLSPSANIPIFGTMYVPNAAKTQDWMQYAEVLWAIGVICFLAWHTFQHVRFLSSVKRWSENIEDTAMLELFTHTKSKLGLQDRIMIKSCACIKTPMLVGLLRPTVLIPQSSFLQDELSLILKHELIHYKRKDLRNKALMMLALSVHWFNPVVYLTVKSALNLCEISCDEEVLKEMDAKSRARYGESIIGVIRSGSACQTAFSTNFYSGTKGMKRRIYAMMDMTAKRFSPVLYFVVLLVTFFSTTTFALSSAQAADIVTTPNSVHEYAADSALPDAKIHPPQTSSGPDANENTATKVNPNDKDFSTDIGSNYLIVSEKVTDKSLSTDISSNYVIVSQNVAQEVNGIS